MATYTKYNSRKGIMQSVFALIAMFCLSLFLLGSYTNKLAAQCTSTTIPAAFVDGDPADWANFATTYPVRAYAPDVFNAGSAADNNFKSSKDVEDTDGWGWWLKGANDKGDIANGVAALTGTNNCILRFAGDRTDNSGACNIGFWFFRNGITLADGKFTPVHTNGDLLILVSLSVGGTLATPKVYEWTSNGLTLNTTASSFACANTNQTTAGVPAGFTYTNKNGNQEYLKNAFFEGAIDLCAAGLGSCFAFFLVETRQSPSETSELEDFAFGTFNATPIPPAPTNGDRCGTGTVNLSASCTTGTVQWYTAETGGTAFTTGNNFTTPSLSTTTDYWISCKQGTCESSRVKITATIKPIPTLSLRVIQPTLCGTGTGTLEVCGEITGYQYAIGSTSYTYNGTPIAFTGLAAGSNPSVTVTATNGCTYTAPCSTAVTTACPGGGITQAATSNEETPSVQQLKEETILARIGANKTRVLAAPNPFSDRVRFTLVSDISGTGSLEIYNTSGQKIATVYRGYVEANKVLNKEYVVQRSLRSNLIYIFRVGDQKTTGKLLNW